MEIKATPSAQPATPLNNNVANGMLGKSTNVNDMIQNTANVQPAMPQQQVQQQAPAANPFVPKAPLTNQTGQTIQPNMAQPSMMQQPTQAPVTPSQPVQPQMQMQQARPIQPQPAASMPQVSPMQPMQQATPVTMEQKQTVYDNANKAVNIERKKEPVKTPVVVAVAVLVIIIVFVFVSMSLRRGAAIRESQDVSQILESPTETTVPMPETQFVVLPDGSDAIVTVIDGEPQIPSRKYTDEQLDVLRKNGYTGEQIESMQKNWVDPAKAIEEAEVYMDNYIDTILDARSSETSFEYRKLLSQTHLGEKKRTKELEANLESSKVITENFDYEKLEPTDRQLPVKLYISDTDDDYIIWYFPVKEYIALKDKGNINVDVTYEDGGNPEERRIITNIKIKG